MLDLTQMSTEELESLFNAAKLELERRRATDEEAIRKRNELIRQARSVLTSAGIGSLRGWSRPGDRRLYANPIDDRGRQWGGSRKYPVSFCFYLDGNSRVEPGWHATNLPKHHSGALEEVPRAVEEALAVIGETLESACRRDFRL